MVWPCWPPSLGRASISAILYLAAASIYGDLGGVSTVKVVEGAFSKLPAAALKVLIRGGNHAQFGWYGEQRGDLPAQISRDQQQDQIFDAFLELMRRVALREGRVLALRFW